MLFFSRDAAVWKNYQPIMARAMLWPYLFPRPDLRRPQTAPLWGRSSRRSN